MKERGDKERKKEGRKDRRKEKERGKKKKIFYKYLACSEYLVSRGKKCLGSMQTICIDERVK